MELRRLKLLQELREAREDLLNINFATDTTNIINFSRPYALVAEWLNKWSLTFQKHYAFINGRMNIPYRIQQGVDGQQREEDPEYLMS